MEAKVCRKCRSVKQLSEFYRHPQMADGHLNTCKECKVADSKAYSKTESGRSAERRRNEKRCRKPGSKPRRTCISDKKRCIKCGVEKSLKDFYAHKQMADGLLGKCKACCKLENAEYRKTDSGKATERRRNQKPSRKKKLYERMAKWRKDNPEKAREQRQRYPDKVRARARLYRAVKLGDVLKEVCEVCGKENVHAHHEDYEKPFEVRWFCAKHHYEHHHTDHMED